MQFITMRSNIEQRLNTDHHIKLGSILYANYIMSKQLSCLIGQKANIIIGDNSGTSYIDYNDYNDYNDSDKLNVYETPSGLLICVLARIKIPTDFFIELYKLYANLLKDPFYCTDQPINNKKFISLLHDLVKKY